MSKGLTYNGVPIVYDLSCAELEKKIRKDMETKMTILTRDGFIAMKVNVEDMEKSSVLTKEMIRGDDE